VTECTEALLKVHGSRCLAAVRAHLVTQLPGLIGKNDMPDVQTVAIGILDTLFEYAAPDSFDLLPKVLGDYTRFCSHAHPDLRQCAAFGLGMVMEKAPPAVADRLAAETLAALRSGLALDCARADEEQSRATDNVVSSILRVARFRGPAPGVDARRIYAECILPNLPATDCPTESKIMHGWLLRAIQGKDGSVLAAAGGGANGARMLLELLGRILGEHHCNCLLSETEVEGGDEIGVEVDETDLPGIIFASDMDLVKRCVGGLVAGLPKEGMAAVMRRLPGPIQELLRDPSAVKDPEALIAAVHGES